MKRLSGLIASFLALAGSASAQITGGGLNGTSSIPELLSQIFGINVGNPYELVGLLATFGLMWVSTYVIFKIALKKLDEGLENGRSGGFTDAVGLRNSDDRNILAVLTLLVTLSIVGTGAFYGVIQGWQSIVLLAFTFMILAGLMFIILGGTGLIFGGGSYIAGKSAKAAVDGVKELSQELDGVRGEESQVDEIEESIDEEEDDVEERERRGDTGGGTGGGSGDGEASGESTAEREIEDVEEKLERAIQLINDIEERLEDDISTELESLRDDLEQLKRILKLLGLEEGSEEFERVKNIVERLEISDGDKKTLLSLNLNFEDAETTFQSITESAPPYAISPDELDALRDYMRNLEDLKDGLDILQADIEIYRRVQQLLERLEDELEHAVEEEKKLEQLISNLDSARDGRKILEEIDYEKDQLETLKEKLALIEEMDSHLQDLEEKIENIESRIGGLEALENALSVRELLVENLIANRRENLEGVKFISFGDEGSTEASLRPGLEILPSGMSHTTLAVDTDMSAGSHTSEKVFEFNDKSRGLISRFEDEMKNFIVSRDIRGKDEVGRELMNLFSVVNQEIHGLSSVDGGRKNILMSNAFSSLRFDSYLVNAVYLGFLIHNFRPIYDHRIVDEDNKSKVGAWRPVRNVLADAHVSLVSYRMDGGVFPCVTVDTDDLGVLYCPATGESLTGIENDRIEETLCTFES